MIMKNLLLITEWITKTVFIARKEKNKIIEKLVVLVVSIIVFIMFLKITIKLL